MANTLALLDATPYRISYLVDEDGTAAGAAVLTNPLTSLTSGTPLYTLLSASYASQALARTAVYEACDISCVLRASSVATGTQLLVDFNVSGTSFRISTQAIKAMATDTGTWVLDLYLRHSIRD